VDEISVRAGDPFDYAGAQRDEESPHGCIDGWVYLGYEGEDSAANGEPTVVIERVPCRRCNIS
jgi:hypothetical protein